MSSLNALSHRFPINSRIILRRGVIAAEAADAHAAKAAAEAEVVVAADVLVVRNGGNRRS